MTKPFDRDRWMRAWRFAVATRVQSARLADKIADYLSDAPDENSNRGPL